jgi:hypothetical protein
LFELGVKNGAFRSDIGQDMVILMFTIVTEGILNPEVLSQIPFTGAQAMETIFKVIFEGIFTEEGRAKYISINSGESKFAYEKQNDLQPNIYR